jgi:hypothetical protein
LKSKISKRNVVIFPPEKNFIVNYLLTLWQFFYTMGFLSALEIKICAEFVLIPEKAEMRRLEFPASGV